MSTTTTLQSANTLFDRFKHHDVWIIGAVVVALILAKLFVKIAFAPVKITLYVALLVAVAAVVIWGVH